MLNLTLMLLDEMSLYAQHKTFIILPLRNAKENATRIDGWSPRMYRQLLIELTLFTLTCVSVYEINNSS